MEIIKIYSHPMLMSDYLKLVEKPNIRIGEEVFFYAHGDLFINIDVLKQGDESAYVNISDEYLQIVDNCEFVAFRLFSESDEYNIEKKEHPLIPAAKKYVYLMMDKTNGYYKIGFSNNPIYRESTLQSEKPMIVLAAYFDGTKDDEKRLHNYFKAKRIRGEWFNLTHNDVEKIISYFNDGVNLKQSKSLCTAPA